MNQLRGKTRSDQHEQEQLKSNEFASKYGSQDLSGQNAGPGMHKIACRIAEAQIDLRRVRYARQKLLSHALNDADFESRVITKAKYELLSPYARGAGLAAPVPEHIIRVLNWKPKGPAKIATILSDMARTLSAFDRYERRTLSRRKFAIRDFDAARGAGGNDR
jgi:hypothetical protein